MVIRVKTIKAKKVEVGMVITAYWEAGRYTSVIDGRVVLVRPLETRPDRDIKTAGGLFREFYNDESVEVQA